MSLQFVIDGFNVTNHPQFRPNNKKATDSCYSLIEFIKNNKLSGSPNNKVMIVFDGYAPVAFDSSAEKEYSVLFARNKSADEKIISFIHKNAGNNNVVLVSDDKEIVLVAQLYRINNISVSEFLAPVEKIKEKIKKGSQSEDSKDTLNYSQVSKINEELKNRWLNKSA